MDLHSLKKGQTVPYEGGEATVQRLFVVGGQTVAAMLRLPDNKFVKVTEIITPTPKRKNSSIFPIDTHPKVAKWMFYIIFAMAIFIALCIMPYFYIV